MKKILLISAFIFAFVIGSYAQAEKTTVTIVDSVALVADTTLLDPLFLNYEWIVWVETWSLDDTDAVFKLEAAADTTNATGWYDYVGADSLTLAADAVGVIQKTNLLPIWLRAITIPNSVSSGEYRVRMQRVRK